MPKIEAPIKSISTVIRNNSVITTIVTDKDEIWESDLEFGWKNIPLYYKEREVQPIEMVERREFDSASLKKAYIKGIFSSQDLYAKNPYSPMDAEFSVWIEGRAFALI